MQLMNSKMFKGGSFMWWKIKLPLGVISVIKHSEVRKQHN